jgi:hypothetical protein
MLGDRPIIRFVSKVLAQSATAVLATLIGGYVLTALNLRTSEPVREAAKPAAVDERALTREYVKSLREGRDGRDDVAEVIRTAPSPAEPQDANETIVAKGVAGQPALVTRPGALANRKEGRLHTDTAAISPVVVPPVAAPALGEPIVLAPAAVAEAADDPRAVRPRTAEPTGVGAVFSTLSNALGSAANATGDTINFMIDLPAKALGQKQTSAQPAVPVAPARAPADTSAPSLRFAGS